MMTGANANQDSPLYGEEVSLKFIWTESEMSMYDHINATYDGTIIADVQTSSRPITAYLKIKDQFLITSYQMVRWI